MVIEPTLPQGCPFVIGGGLIRDAILGGRPSDIDVWLPSNLSMGDLGTYLPFVARRLPNYDWTVRFTGPGADNQGVDLTDLTNLSDYGDVNNHWVLEGTCPFLPSVNLMRSMTRWETGPQDFFNGLMRAFDIDQCMFFIGLMPGQRTIDTVIAPLHLVTKYNQVAEGGRGVNLRDIQLNEIYWNRYRLERTSRQRIDARLAKMYSKYNFNAGQASGDTPPNLPLESIIATPIKLKTVVLAYDRVLNNQSPYPTFQNKRQLSEDDEDGATGTVLQAS